MTECFLRQNDVIGQWRKIKPGYVAQAGDVVIGDKYWRGMTMDEVAWLTEAMANSGQVLE